MINGFLEPFTKWIQDALGLAPSIQGKLFISLLIWLAFIALRLVLSLIIHRRLKDVSKQYMITKTLHYVLTFESDWEKAKAILEEIASHHSDHPLYLRTSEPPRFRDEYLGGSAEVLRPA